MMKKFQIFLAAAAVFVMFAAPTNAFAAPTASISAWQWNGRPGQNLTFTANASGGGSTTGIRIYRTPASYQSWSLMNNTICNGSTCSLNTSWTAETGDWFIVVNAYANPNTADYYTNNPATECTGNPWGYSAAWSSCGTNGNLWIRISNPPTPSVSTGLACTPGDTGNMYTVSWATSSPAITYLDVSSSSNFATYFNKAVTGTSTPLSSGITGYWNGSSWGGGSLTLFPNTTYYTRLWDGYNFSDTATFITPSVCAPPRATMTSPSTTAVIGQTLTLAATANGSGLSQMIMYRSRTTVQSWTQVGATKSCGGASTCSISVDWTPAAADAGDWYFVVDVWGAGGQCSSNPFGISAPWINCGGSGYVGTTITVPLPPTPSTTINNTSCTPTDSSNEVTISWSNANPAVTYVDISDNNFTVADWYNKYVAGSSSTNASGGFSGPKGSLTLQPNTTYYVRLWNGSTHSNIVQFTTPTVSCTCSGYTIIDTPTNNTTYTVGTAYSMAGWGTFCSGPNGTNRNRVDPYICDQGTWNNCRFIGPASSYTRQDVVNAGWTCGNLNPNPDGWTFNWTPDGSFAGAKTLRVASINDAAASCVVWDTKDINIIYTPPSANFTSGPTTAVTGQTITLAASAGGAGLSQMIMYRSRTTTQSWTQVGATKSCGGTSTCSISVDWIPAAADAGDWYFVVDVWGAGGQCSSNPFGISAPWINCGGSGYVKTTINLAPPTSLSGSCPIPGTKANISWTGSSGNTYNVRLDDGDGINNSADALNSSGNVVADNCGSGVPHDVCVNGWTSTSMTVATTANKTYSWWVHACNINGVCSAPATGTSFTCTPLPPPPTAAITAPTNSSSITINQPTTVSATATGTNITSMNVYRIPTSANHTIAGNWLSVTSCDNSTRSPCTCSGQTCSVGGSWTPGATDTGQWDIAVNAFDAYGQNCSGRHLTDLTGFWKNNCDRNGSTSMITITAILPNCNQTPGNCTGTCSSPTTCYETDPGNGTQTGCSFTTFSGGGSCTPVPTTQTKSCTLTPNCTSPNYCSSGTCINLTTSATTSCGTGVARATGLVSSPQTSQDIKFNTTGACAINTPTLTFAPFKLPSYDDLKSLYYTQAKSSSTVVKEIPQSGGRIDLGGNQDHVYSITGDLTISSPNDITGTQTGVIFVEGNLNIGPISSNKLNYGNNTSGLVFIVKGNVNIAPSVTQIDAIIIAQGKIYTAGANCSLPSAATPGTDNQLVINGSLVSLDENKTIEFCRKLANNATIPAEKINQDPKYLVILRNLYSDILQKWSEIQ